MQLIFERYRSLKTKKAEFVDRLEFYEGTPDSKLTLIKSVTFVYDRLLSKPIDQ